MQRIPQWLDQAVIYQIYPQSFQDSNGDGIGDIPGIIRRLDYLQWLGVTVIWLNPCFDSPFGDAGYDVRDFFKVVPRYGTQADLEALFDEARKRGIRVILDLVAGHTSIEHPLFLSSASGPDSPDADRYIWMNRDFDPATGPTEKNFVHNFFWYQPALNFGYARPAEPWQDAVDAPGPRRNRAMLKEIMAWWMDLGAAGFRVDMAASLVKEDPGHVETIRLWNELREWWDAHYPDNVLVAEWSHPAEAIPAGFHLDFLMHFNVDAYRSLFFNEEGALPYPEGHCYFDHRGRGTPRVFMPVYQRELEAVRGRGWISLPTANHDFQRLRCGPRGWEGLPVAWVFLMTQAGPPTIYMGDEIGMRYVPGVEPREGSTLFGVTAPNAGAINGERAGTRTPMQWDDSPNAGFSPAPAGQLYLPLDPDPQRPHLAAQRRDPGSLLHFVRQLLQLRHAHPALGAAADYRFRNPEGVDYPLLVERSVPGQRCLIALNPQDAPAAAELAETASAARKLLDSGASIEPVNGRLRIRLPPFGYAIVELG
jgi:maltose alpha-D-glucosyltransferase/alpha-amylase